jgi:O-antigen/teichoic acid export membrane protein
MPYIVHNLGNEAYGVLALVTSVLGFFAFLDLGVTNASVKYMAEAYALGDVEKINKIIGSSLVVYLIAGGTGACIIALMTNTLVQRILKIPPGYIADSTFAFYIASCGFLLNMVLGVFASVPKAVQRYDVATKVNIAVSTSLTLLTVFILYLGYGLREVVILNFFSSLASLTVYMLVAKKLVKGISIKVSYDPATFKQLFAFGAYSLLVMISSAFLFQLDRLMIGSFAGAGQVAFYVVPASIALRIHGFVASIMGVVFPLCSELHATGQQRKLRELYLKASKYSFVLGISIATPLVVLSTQIMAFWMGNEYAAKSSLVLAVLSVSSLFATLTIIPSFLLDGIGKPRVNAFFAVLSALLNIVLCIMLIPRYGVNGAALAVLANCIIVALYLVTIDKKILHIGLMRFAADTWSRPIAAALVQGAVTFYLVSPFISGVVTLVSGLAVSIGIFYLAALLFKAFTEEDMQQFQQFVQAKLQ